MNVVIALVGVCLLIAGGVFTLGAAYFGAAGLFDRHRPAPGAVAFGIVVALVGVAAIIWSAT